ncbi:hypothetical protein LG634_09130 [Streptomyces bambusae]|uniref:hypothetical protein n=1 Tax=Streptomyces bambusae TaxID=1550616 RepID=UPI001CFD34AC|nr:hypothetical protein [Streptomyces bambusae]MCB5164990.1 hypothetical protein [Streptomyces bambusae]
MSRVTVEGDEVVVRLGFGEWLPARRREIRVPASTVRGVRIETNWWRALRGEAGRGRWAPGRCVGVRQAADGEQFVALKAGGPVLCMELGAGAPFREVAVSVRAADAEEAQRVVRAAMPEAPGESVDSGGEAGRERLLLPHEGRMVDEHGRPPGVPSRTGSGAAGQPLDAERVDRANADRPRRDHVVRWADEPHVD